jgi:hypothetical protein
MAQACRVGITARDLVPAPCHEAVIGPPTSLERLHDTTESAFPWQDAHIGEVEIEGRHDPDARSPSGERTRKAAAMERARPGDAILIDVLCA